MRLSSVCAASIKAAEGTDRTIKCAHKNLARTLTLTDTVLVTRKLNGDSRKRYAYTMKTYNYFDKNTYKITKSPNPVNKHKFPAKQGTGDQNNKCDRVVMKCLYMCSMIRTFV